MCEKCLNGLRPESDIQRHYLKCPIENPPGKRIINDKHKSLYEIDGGKESADYCRQLCLIAMFFISGKVAYHEVEHFMFYILTAKVGAGHSEEVVGYYSRDKDLSLNQTMSCLFIFPAYMKKGYGSFLIDHSYKMARKLDLIGSPEKPLSSMGLRAFRKYWCRVINEYVENARNHSKISLKLMSNELSICEKDIVSSLQFMGKLKRIDEGYFILK